MSNVSNDAQRSAKAVFEAFVAYRLNFFEVTKRARKRFENRDWRGGQQDALERLQLRDHAVQAAVTAVVSQLHDSVLERPIWTEMRALYSDLIRQCPDTELAESFFNSVTRRIFITVGVDPNIEFVATGFIHPAPDGNTTSNVYKTFALTQGESLQRLVHDILKTYAFSVPFENLQLDIGLCSAAVEAYLHTREDQHQIDGIDIATSVFYRGKSAYLVGRMRRGPRTSPFILALLNGDNGVVVDALLLTPSDASILFSFTRSYFHVEMERSADLVAFLRSIMPQKRISELYIAIGHNKHGKTELYREILDHLGRTKDLFFPARGDRGLVMVVFTLPSLDMVFKIIRDRFAPPKSITRQQVMQKYQLVFQHDRAGRLVDAQEFEHLTFSANQFDSDLLEELRRECADTVHVEDDTVEIKHVYVERRVTPLNVYLRESDELAATLAVLDYGQAIRDLAATNTFPGDLLLKNFGVTRHGRVIFYDYDELTLVTVCNFRDLPQPQTLEQEMSAEPWFYVADNDIFPEEFMHFLNFSEAQKRAFSAAHGEILTAVFWRTMQARLRAGEIVDIFPYRPDQKLQH